MLIDIVNPGWAPVFQSNLTEDVPGYLEAPANALAYSWEHFIAGHLGRLGTRDDIALHQQYMADIADASRNAIDNTDLTRYFEKYPDNLWAAFRGGLEEVVANAAAPVIEKYTGARRGGRVHRQHDVPGAAVHPARSRPRIVGAPLMASLPVPARR